MNTIFDKVAIEKCCDDFFSLYDITREHTRDMCHAKRVHTHAVAEMTNFDAVPDADKIVLEKAIHHHSDFKLPNDLTDRELMFCDIIREADCIDIFRSIVTSGWKTLYNCTAEDVLATDISPVVEEAFQRRETVKNSNRVTLADYRMAHIALCFVLKS